MEIHRNEPHGSRKATIARISDTLDLLEGSECFSEGIHWDVEIVPHLSVEDVIRALVSAEQELK